MAEDFDYSFRDDNWIADEVTIDGVMYRRDWPVLTPEGQALIAEVKAVFPDYVLDDIPTGSIGRNEAGMRPPYDNDTISWYAYGAVPDHMRVMYQINDTPAQDGGGRIWYGLKFDMKAKQVMVKMPCQIENFPLPKHTPNSSYNFLGKLYYPDGRLDDAVDVYMNVPQLPMLAYFCRHHKIDLPIDMDEYRIEPWRYCWGFVYNWKTLEVLKLKLYKFHQYEKL